MFEILHKACGGLAYYCPLDIAPQKGQLHVPLNKLDGAPMQRGEMMICPSCGKEIGLGISSLTTGKEI
jgi:hypothetical protein